MDRGFMVDMASNDHSVCPCLRNVLQALSCNGRDFSRMVEIASSTGVHGRTTDQPVDGLLTRGDTVSVLIHRAVYEIHPHARPVSRIVRKQIQRQALQRYAELVRPTLSGC